MGILELKQLIQPLSEEDRQTLRKLLDEPAEDHPIFHMGEMAAQLAGTSEPPADFAKNFRQYSHERKIAHE